MVHFEPIFKVSLSNSISGGIPDGNLENLANSFRTTFFGNTNSPEGFSMMAVIIPASANGIPSRRNPG